MPSCITFQHLDSDGGSDDSNDGPGTRITCKCCRFTSGLDLPEPNDEMSIDDIRQEAEEFSTSISDNWTQAKVCIERYEPVIHKRWLKKSVKKRQEILLRAWLDIPRNHRPDFEGARHRCRRQATAITQPSQAFLTPYLNVEDLVHDHHILLLLNSRGRLQPESFVQADLDNSHRGLCWPCNDEVVEGPGLVFDSQQTPRLYGRLVNEDEIANDPERSRCYFAPIVGCFILQVQASIYQFVLDCCKSILHDIEPSTWPLAPVLPAPALPSVSPDSTQWKSAAAMARALPYRGPQRIDLDRIKFLCGTKLAEVEDHIHLLRTDPSYFVAQWQDTHTHCMEFCNVLDIISTKGWAHVAGRLIGDAFGEYWIWENLYRMLCEIPSIDQESLTSNKDNGLTVEDQKKWATLEQLLRCYMLVSHFILTNGAFISPDFQTFVGRARVKACVSPWYLKDGATDAESRVFIIFTALEDEAQLAFHGMQHLVQEVQNLIDHDPAASNLIDGWVLSKFADYALLVELDREIRAFQPWAREWKRCLDDDQSIKSIVIETMDRLKSDANFLDLLTSDHHHEALEGPHHPHWKYPVTKRMTKETTEQVIVAENSLAEIWKAVDDAFFEETEEVLWAGSGGSHHAGSGRKTQPWTESRPTDAPSIKTKNQITPSQPSPTPKQDHNNLSTAIISDNKRRELLDQQSATRIKIKTRAANTIGEPTPPVREENSAAAIHDPTASDQPKGPITVPRRAARVFEILFPQANSHAHIGKEISWQDFLTAMNDAGLRPEKLYGSVWAFRPVANAENQSELRRSVQFHEPREVRRGSKISPIMVSAFRRRLKYAFGWEAGVFVSA